MIDSLLRPGPLSNCEFLTILLNAPEEQLLWERPRDLVFVPSMFSMFDINLEDNKLNDCED